MKKCRRCGISKNEKYFSKNNSRKSGLHSYCLICSRKYNREHYLRNKEKTLSRNKKWIANNRERYNETKRKYDKRIKLKVFNHYSGGSLKCNCCGEDEIIFLTIDHVNNNGAEEKRKLNIRGNNFYHYLSRNNFPEGYQVLCYNCNCGRKLGICPHKL